MANKALRQEPIGGQLHSLPSRPATLVDWIVHPLEPFLLVLTLLYYGVPGAIREQFSNPSLHLLNPFRWKALILSNGFGPILAGANKLYQNIKGPLLKNAYGTVLEVGAGSGETVMYYDNEKIKHLFCLEPYAPLQAKLAAAIAKKGLNDKATIVPSGLQSRVQLNKSGITPGTIDTIVLVQVLCSIPEPKSHLEYLQSLLKPGGQILLFEHVASKHATARKMQDVLTVPWGFTFGGCCMNRDSADWLKDIGGWKEAKIERPVEECSAQLFPHAVARFVKA
eukprot:TRINITY_DN711_c0_g1_i1.p1 TRINITY_DN711_c0_g1~~TRINITY_DN711_c0_g1_i1.p1  ORF type:complete len:281 (-),score=64.16 TRINITY_DN711_c0_g1_i1:70-912(-)